MTEETKLPKILYKEKEYDQKELTKEQQYLFSQVFDLQKKENKLRFKLDQIGASKEKMEEHLDKELKNG
tara:strand:- start:339 stop:545 length:207 start_codon:yes stop_codon:yes gene_type:complete